MKGFNFWAENTFENYSNYWVCLILSFLFVRVCWTLYQWMVISDLHVCLMELAHHF